MLGSPRFYKASMWQPISSAPFDRDLELAVVDKREHHALVFPCRRISDGWIECRIKKADRREPHSLARVGRKALNQSFSFFDDFY